MKKVLAVLVALMMVFSFTVSTMAAEFVQSPSNNMAPELMEGECGISGCEGGFIIVPYGERATLSDEDCGAFEGAYSSISNADDLTDLNDQLEKLVNDHGINSEDLSVSDLFFVDTDEHTHDGNGNYSIKLKAETLDNFVGLLRFDGEKWHWVDGAAVDGGMLMFNTKEAGSFAIVVDKGADKKPSEDKNESSKNETGKDESSKVSSTEITESDKTEKPQTDDSTKSDSSKSDTPKTGESNRIYLWIMLFAVSAILIIFVVFKRRKNNES